MITDRYDPHQEKYARADSLENVSRWLFWAAAVCFSIKITTHWIPADRGELLEPALHWSEWGFVIFAASAFVLMQVGRFYIHELGDHERRKLLLSDGLGVKLSAEASRNYYNNNEAPSLRRLLFNLAESIFFSQSLLQIEMQQAFVITLAALVAVIISLWTGEPSLVEFAAVVLFFSDFILGRYVKLRWATSRLTLLSTKAEQLAKQPLPQQQLTLAAKATDLEHVEEQLLSQNKFLSTLIEIACEYDNIKARIGARSSKQVFERFNEQLTAEWVEREKSFWHEKHRDPEDTLIRRFESA